MGPVLVLYETICQYVVRLLWYGWRISRMGPVSVLSESFKTIYVENLSERSRCDFCIHYNFCSKRIPGAHLEHTCSASGAHLEHTWEVKAHIFT